MEDYIREMMSRTLAMALTRIGITSPNPPVGAIVVRDGNIISQGGTQVCGGEHAEVCALGEARGLANGSDMFVSLEPCCHHGRTPPCTDAIIRAGIKRIFIPLTDINPKVSGAGVRALRESGIEVVMCPEFEKPAREIIAPFITLMQKNRPHVLYKTAATSDFHTATDSGDSKWISSSASRLLVHRLRLLVDAVIVGKKTVDYDNPSLTARLEDFNESDSDVLAKSIPFLDGENIVLEYLMKREFAHEKREPIAVVAGLPQKVDRTRKLFIRKNTLVFERRSAIDLRRSDPNVQRLINDGILLETDDDIPLSISILEELKKRGIMFVLLEGGSRTAGEFFKVNVIDQYCAFIAPVMTGGGLSVTAGGSVEKMENARDLSERTLCKIGNDLLYHGYVRGK